MTKNVLHPADGVVLLLLRPRFDLHDFALVDHHLLVEGLPVFHRLDEVAEVRLLFFAVLLRPDKKVGV